MKGFQNKAVVIVGGSSGIGLKLAELVVKEGATAYIVGRTLEKLKSAKTSIQGDVHIHQTNLGKEEDVKTLAKQIDRIDHLVFTAADLTFKPFLEQTDEEIQRALSSKFWGSVYMIRHFASKIAKNGSITFYTGVVALKATEGASIVAAVNGALVGLMRTLALELKPVRVNAVSPGVVDTPTWNFLKTNERKQLLKEIGDSLPIGRVGKAEELADAGMYMMTNGFTTGTVLEVDGGANA